MCLEKKDLELFELDTDKKEKCCYWQYNSSRFEDLFSVPNTGIYELCLGLNLTTVNMKNSNHTQTVGQFLRTTLPRLTAIDSLLSLVH